MIMHPIYILHVYSIYSNYYIYTYMYAYVSILTQKQLGYESLMLSS